MELFGLFAKLKGMKWRS